MAVRTLKHASELALMARERASLSIKGTSESFETLRLASQAIRRSQEAVRSSDVLSKELHLPSELYDPLKET